MDEEIFLLIDDEKIPCNRQDLQKESQYFNSMFNIDMIESKQKEIRLHDVDLKSMKILINFAHTGNISFNHNICQDLLEMSVRFQFDGVTNACCIYLKNGLNNQNSLSIWTLSDSLGLKELSSESKKCAIMNFIEIVEDADLKYFPKHLLIELLSNDYLVCKKEINVFNTVIKWIENNTCSSFDIINLLSCVRYNLLTAEDWKSFCNHSSVNSNEYVKSYLYKAHNFLKQNKGKESEFDLSAELNLKIENKSNISVKELCGDVLENVSREMPLSDIQVNYKSNPRIVPSAIIFVQDVLDSLASNKQEVLFLNFRILDGSGTINTLIKFKVESSYTQPLVGYRVCVVENNIYLLGGEYGFGTCHWNMNVWKSDISKKTLLLVATLPKPRRSFNVIVLGSCIYLLGGFGQYRKSLDSMDCYDTKEDLWKQTEKLLPHIKSSSDVIAHQGLIYAFGTGIDTYYPESNMWKSSQMPSEDIVPIKSAFSCDANIYLISRKQNSLVIYDPNTKAMKMSNISLDPSSLFSFIIDNSIYLFSEATVSVINLVTEEKEKFPFPSNVNPDHIVNFPFYDHLKL